MIAIEDEWVALDLVEGARREYERRASAIDLLTDLPGRLPVDVQILDREGELPVDMTVVFALFGRDSLGRQCIRIIVPCSAKRVLAVVGDQHSCGGLPFGTPPIKIKIGRASGREKKG